MKLDLKKSFSEKKTCQGLDAQSPTKKIRSPTSDASAETKDHPLARCMKKNLSDILHEGLLDSVLPYMLPKPVFSQPIIKKPITSVEPKKTASLGASHEGRAAPSANRDKDKDKNKPQRKPTE